MTVHAVISHHIMPAPANASRFSPADRRVASDPVSGLPLASTPNGCFDPLPIQVPWPERSYSSRTRQCAPALLVCPFRVKRMAAAASMSMTPSTANASL
jgi:hypothetical protein